MFRFKFGPLMEAAGDGSGAGGGSGAPAGLTEARVNELVAAGVKTGLDGFEKGAFKAFAEKVPTADSIAAIVASAVKGVGGGNGTGSEGNGGGQNNGGAPNPQTNAEIKRLGDELKAATNKFNDSETRRAETEKKALATDKESKIRAALQGYDFVNDEAREDAYNVLDRMVTRDESGALVADNLPLESFAKDFVPNKKSYLLKPVGTAGSGATHGTPKINGRAAGIEDIRPGMSADESKAVGAAIKAAAGDLFGRR